MKTHGQHIGVQAWPTWPSGSEALLLPPGLSPETLEWQGLLQLPQTVCPQADVLVRGFLFSSHLTQWPRPSSFTAPPSPVSSTSPALALWISTTNRPLRFLRCPLTYTRWIRPPHPLELRIWASDSNSYHSYPGISLFPSSCNSRASRVIHSINKYLLSVSWTFLPNCKNS